jgi:hypothetical protein
MTDKDEEATMGGGSTTFCELCGGMSPENVVVVAKMWGEVSYEVGEARGRELASNFFKPALNNDAQLVRNTKQAAHAVIRNTTVKRPVALRIQRELVEGPISHFEWLPMSGLRNLEG